jgi:hypothetical protein
MPAAGSVSQAGVLTAAPSARRSAMAAPTAATARPRRRMAAAVVAIRLVVAPEPIGRCLAPRARVVARRPRCLSSPAATSPCTAQRVSSSAAAVATVPAGGAATRAAVATRWRAASSGDRSDNLETAPLTARESKLLWKPALDGCWQGMTLVRWSRWSMTCASCATKPIAMRTSNPRRMRCGRTAAPPAS